ncbi:MAG: hypothetical protein QOF65_2681 [Thermoleophilaceae bacterium]|jgi:hypothetical protein|nr:hypothetical protein [Thermoleophilaceae bacterium]
MTDEELTAEPADCLPYEAPQLEVIGTVLEATMGPFEIGADGTGGFLS